MRSSDIYAKTELGVRELKQHDRNLPLPLRSLLIMIDGNRTVADVLDKARALRLDDNAFETLTLQGLIAPKFSVPGAADTRKYGVTTFHATDQPVVQPWPEPWLLRLR